jgi:biotin transport system substrate-specific component
MNRSVIAPGLATINRIWTAETQVDRATRAVVLAVIGTGLLWASARMQVPFWPVKMSMQTLVVMLIGAFYGSRLGAATVAAYLLEGLAGLPVFQSTPEQGIGLAYMMGPTGGYLAGFVVLAFLVGLAVERGLGRSILTMVVATLGANVIFYAFGLGWLSSLFGVQKAIAFGLMPFLVADAVKILIAASVTVAASRLAQL